MFNIWPPNFLFTIKLSTLSLGIVSTIPPLTAALFWSTSVFRLPLNSGLFTNSGEGINVNSKLPFLSLLNSVDTENFDSSVNSPFVLNNSPE